MPLHLLGKKSWNVYNKSNIERVHRDEAEAQAKQQELERRRRDNDAAERLALLRGDDTSALESAGVKGKRQDHDETSTVSGTKRPRSTHTSHGDDTRPDRQRANTSSDSLDLDKISNMRFRDAAGRNSRASEPWYSTLSAEEPQPSAGTNVWGKEDAGRAQRDQRRLDASDPMLAMKRGVKQLREVERQKEEWRRERELDLGEVEVLAMRKQPRRGRDRHRHRHRHRSRDAHREDEDDTNTRRRRDKARNRSKDEANRPQRSRHRSRSPKR